ncbi:hypothetical protein Tco_0880965 [Tanacetum coccineum]
MLAQPTEDEGVVLERPYETQPTPSSTQPSEDLIEPQPNPSLSPSSSNLIPNSIPEGSGGNHRGQSSSDRSLLGNENGLTLQSVYDLYVSLCKQVTTQVAQIKDLKSQIKQLKKKAKHGRKPAKSEPTVHKDLVFDDLDDAMDYMETEDAQDEETMKDNEGTRVSTEDLVSTDKTKVSTDKPNEGTAEPDKGTAEPNKGTVESKDGNSDESATPTMTSTPTLIVFGDDETIAQVLITMSQNKVRQKEKEKGIELKDVEDSDRPRPTSTRSLLTLKPLPKIDPKDKGKKVLEEEAESYAESKGVNEAERKFAQLANDEEIARKVQEEWETEEKNKKVG